MKQLIRSYIQKAEINLYTDTFKLLMKYEDHYILEDVCADIYRKCANSIHDKCTLDNLEFTNYVQEIIGDDLEMKNVTMKRLKHELSTKKTETADNISVHNENLFKIEKERSKFKKRLTATKKKDNKEGNVVNAKTESVPAQKYHSEVNHVNLSPSKECVLSESFHWNHVKQVKFQCEGMKVKVVSDGHIFES